MDEFGQLFSMFGQRVRALCAAFVKQLQFVAAEFTDALALLMEIFFGSGG